MHLAQLASFWLRQPLSKTRHFLVPALPALWLSDIDTQARHRSLAVWVFRAANSAQLNEESLLIDGVNPWRQGVGPVRSLRRS